MNRGIPGLLQSVARVSGANVINGLLSIIFIPVALGKLGEAGYGALSVYWFVIGYLALAELGIGKNLLRELASAETVDTRRYQLQHALSAYVIIAAAVALASPLLAWIIPRLVIPFGPDLIRQVEAIVLLTVVDYLVGIVVSLHTAAAVAGERFTQYSRFQSISGVLRYGSGLMVLLLVPAPTPVLVAAAFVARRVLELPLAVALLGHLPEGTWRTWQLRLNVGATLMRSSSLSVAQLLQTTVTSASTVLIGHSGGAAMLGIFRACFDLASRLWFISNAFGLVLFPRFSRLQATESGRSKLALFLPSALSLSAALVTSFGVAASLFAVPVLSLFGLHGNVAWGIFALSMAGVALHAHGGVPYELLQANGLFNKAAVIAASALVGLVVTYAIVPGQEPWRAVGWAWFVSQAVYCLYCRLEVTKLLTGDRSFAGNLPLDELLATAALGIACFAVLTTSVPLRAGLSLIAFVLVVVMAWRAKPSLALLTSPA